MIYLYSCSGSADHGCEAAARAVKQLLGYPMRLYSEHAQEEYAYRMDELMDIGEDTDDLRPKKGRRFTIARMQTKFGSAEEREVFFRRQEMLSAAKAGDIWLCMDETAYARIEEVPDGDEDSSKGRRPERERRLISGEELDDLLKGVPVTPQSRADEADAIGAVAPLQCAERSILAARGAKTVLFNCAVDAVFAARPEVKADLKAYDLIIAAESITYEAVRQINPNVLLSADPAFHLPPVYAALPDGWREGKMFGMQISADADPKTLQSIRSLIEIIFEKTDDAIALIPYTVREGSDDRVIQKQVYERFRDTGRVLQFDDCGCMELNGYIARCKMLICMQTGAAIAAWSSGVPALIMRDAIKARGIARDLFGAEDRYVIQPDSDPAEAFLWLLDHEADVRLRLKEYLPEYKKKISQTKEAIDALIH